MAAKLIQAVADTGQTVYAVVRRDLDGFLLDDADGSFAAAPTDFYLSLAEDGTVKGLYKASESRIPWDDGQYTLIPYIQLGGSPATMDDIPGSAEQMSIAADAEVTVGTNITNISSITASLFSLRKGIAGITETLAEVLRFLNRIIGLLLDLEKKVIRKG